MAEKIEYYINEKNRSVTAVINNPDTDAYRNIRKVIHNHVSNDIVPTIASLNLYKKHVGLVDKLSSTVIAEPEIEFNNDTIERLKYIAKCSVKNKYHNRLEKIYFMYTEILDRMCNAIKTNLIKKNQYILKTRPFKYVDPEDWDKVKKNRARNRLDEI